MNIILFGGTGMVGQGVLREALLDPRVERILSISRSSIGQQHPKLSERVLPNVGDLSSIESELSGYDACLFTLGTSSFGMNEADYRKITYDLTLAVANTLARVNPSMVFEYVSGAGTDSSEKGRAMWGRVKGETENRLLEMPFRAAYMCRPGFIQPMHGIKSRTRLYRALYGFGSALYPVLKAIAPRHMMTNEDVARAMLQAAEHGAPKKVLEAPDLLELAKARTA